MNTNTLNKFKFKESMLNALTIEERKELLDLTSNIKINQQKIKEWKTKSFADENEYQKYLRGNDLTEIDFENILSAIPQNYKNEFKTIIEKTYWYNVLIESLNINNDYKKKKELSLAIAIQPFLLWAYKELKNKITTLKNYKSNIEIDKFLNKFLESLAKELLNFAYPSLILEVNIHRLLNELDGNTPEDRFQSFVKNKLYNNQYLKSFYSEYTVLSRILATRTLFTVNNVSEALNRFNTDLEELDKLFQIKNEKLLEINFGVGDKHQKGNSVMKFCFTSNKKIIYKPKSVEISNEFHKFINWISSLGLKQNFKFQRTLVKKEYGWEEFVEYKPCLNTQEVSNYYYRYGSLLGIIYLLKGVDFHYENVIAHGEHPIIIDLETLFHNTPKMKIDNTIKEKINYQLFDSVLGTNLLPVYMFKNEDNKGIELSGLGGKEQLTPFDVKTVEQANTDEIKVVKKPILIKEAQNIPKINGKHVKAAEYYNYLIEGFKDTLKLVIKNKNLILEKNSPLHNFKNLPVRIIVRNTQKYGTVIYEANHPDFMRDILDREKVIDIMWNYPLNNIEILKSEKEDLLIGDIPFFTTLPSSVNLYDSNGKIIKNVFEKSSFILVLNRISNLSDKEINNQINLIKSSLVNLNDETK